MNLEKKWTDHSTSKPLLAATLSGMLSVWTGSTMPSIGRMALLAIPVYRRPIRGQNRSESVESSRDWLTFTGFGFQRLVVEDGDAGGLTAGSCSRRN